MKSGAPVVRAPVYSHLAYDVVAGEQVAVRAPDVLLVEGLNVLQPPRTRADGGSSLAVSDFFDFSIYVDAAESDVRRWYVERFLRLRDTAFADPASYFHRFAGLDDAAAVAHGHGDLGPGQRAEPGAEHPADPRPGDAGAGEGPRPRGTARPAAQALKAVVASQATRV